MQPPTILPIHEIKVEDRQRKDLGDLTSLANSLKEVGLIQPVVINQSKQLIAGGRRLAAGKLLGWDSISVIYRETLSKAELHILELEENIRRKAMSWQEECLGIATVHRHQQREKALASEGWTQQATATLLGVSSTREINHALAMARRLEAELDASGKPKEDSRFWKCETFSEAFRLVTQDEIDEAVRIQSERLKANADAVFAQFEEETLALSIFEQPDALEDERERYYSNPLNPPDSFNSYWAERQALKVETQNRTIPLSRLCIQGDSIQFMRENSGRFDHIITDIPYGIDMEMLNQQNQHGGISGLEGVEELHDVDYNLQLIADFFEAAFTTTKENAFVITWCDLSGSPAKNIERIHCHTLWEYMTRCATNAGFIVQKWPVFWYKNQAMNQCISYNTTKDYEPAIVCRKPGATICQQPHTSIIQCGKDELCSLIDHPFAKPFAAWEYLINAFTLKGETILEPFAGRGSGMISMLKLERGVIGVELDPVHHSHLLNNVKNYYLSLNPSFLFI